MATQRSEKDPVLVATDIKVVYCANKTKLQATREQGYNVDIWIDDHPATVETLALTWRERVTLNNDLEER